MKLQLCEKKGLEKWFTVKLRKYFKLFPKWVFEYQSLLPLMTLLKSVFTSYTDGKLEAAGRTMVDSICNPE